MNFKKIIACILAFAMLLSAFGAYADSSRNAREDEIYRSMDILRTFGFIPDYYDYNVNPETAATRADFAVSLAKIMNLTEYSGGEIYYYDVYTTHWAYKEISALTQSGVLGGVGGGLFRPDDTVTLAEGYAMLCNALGYRQYAAGSGGFPTGYIKAAQKAELDEGMTASGALTIGDMFVLLYNGIKANILEPYSFGNDGASYRVSEDETLLTCNHNIARAQGILCGAECVDIDGGELAEGEIKLDGTVYTTELSCGDYLGQMTEIFYIDDGSNGKKKVIWAGLTGETDYEEIIVDDDADFNPTSFVLTYHDGDSDKDRKITLSRNITVIYNGGAVTAGVDKIFNMPRYTARFIKSDGKYTVAVVRAHEDVVVERIDTEQKIIYDKLSGDSLSLDSDDYTRMSVKLLGAAEVSWSTIVVGNVLSVYKSLDKKFLEVSLCTEQIEGTVQSVTDEENGSCTVTMNGIDYKVRTHDSISPGMTITIYMNSEGEGVYVKISGTTLSPAYLIDGVNETKSMQNYISLKTLTSDGKVVVYKCRDNLKIDGVPYDNKETAFSKLCRSGLFMPQFVMIELGADGLVSYIDTVNNGNDNDIKDALSVSVPYKAGQEYLTFGYLGPRMAVNDSTLVFFVPEDDSISSAADSEFYVASSKTLEGSTSYNTESYKTDDRVGYEQYVVAKGAGATYGRTNPVLVEKITSRVSGNGDVRECLIGFQGSASVELLSGEDFKFSSKGIDGGDIVRVKVNRLGEVEDTTTLVDYSDIENSITNAPTSTSSYTPSFGYAYDVIGDVIKLSYDKANINNPEISITAKGIPVLVYDSNRRNNKARQGTLGDILTYYNNGTACSEVFMLQRSGVPALFIAYK